MLIKLLIAEMNFFITNVVLPYPETQRVRRMRVSCEICT
jgi:hypothetical protein